VKVFAGLLLVALGFWSAYLLRRGARFRLPTIGEQMDICGPLAEIACRHLPMAAIGPDVVDMTSAVAATNHYVTRAPLITPLHTQTEEDPS
jgi:hypothetical protein